MACPTIFDANSCTLDETVTCPIFFGESGKISLYHEPATDTGTHQSEEVGAWLSAAVIYGAVQSSDACYLSQSVLESVMPTVSNLAAIPSGISIEELVSEAANSALRETFGSDIPECGGTPSPTVSLFMLILTMYDSNM